MKRFLVVLIGVFSLAGLAALVTYFLSEPDRTKTQERAKKFHQAAQPGAALTKAIHASPDFHSVIFGPCGHLDASPDSGPKGSLIYSPAEGPFARYSGFEEFMRLNPKLIEEHEGCRRLTVQYMVIFPYQGTVDVDVNEKGIIVQAAPPVFGT